MSEVCVYQKNVISSWVMLHIRTSFEWYSWSN